MIKNICMTDEFEIFNNKDLMNYISPSIETKSLVGLKNTYSFKVIDTPEEYSFAKIKNEHNPSYIKAEKT